MQIYSMALYILTFSFVLSLMAAVGLTPNNELGQMNNYSFTDEEEAEIMELVEVDPTEASWLGDILGQIGDGIDWAIKSMGIVGKVFGMALGIGTLIGNYVPGVVGEALKHFINSICLFIYAWGLIQFVRRYNSKGAD